MMSQEIPHYQYSFEIEDILKQFIALIDKAIIMRYEKVENERRLVQTITPLYKFSTKSRVLLLSLNSSKNYTLPVVAIELTGISADKERMAAKNHPIHHFQNGLLEAYNRPTPITIQLKVSIITKYVTDLYQIYGKLATQFQPELFYSWAVPTNQKIHAVEELRNKIEWDFNITFDNREKITENDEDRFVGTMNFTVQGWLFPNQKCRYVIPIIDENGKTISTINGKPILDIGTSVLVTNELENRIDGLINQANPLVSEWLKDGRKMYKNPREFATAHIRILKAFVTSRNHNFRIYKDRFDSFSKSTIITLDGYNLSNAKVLFVPKEKHSIRGLTTYQYDDKGKLFPVIETSEEKPKNIKGKELKILSKSDNLLQFELSIPNNYKGNFDIIVYDDIDYDTFYNAEGFYLIANQ